MQKEEDKTESLYEFVLRTLDETFLDNIPMDSIKDLPRFYLYLFGALAELMSLAIFVYFFLAVYHQGVTQFFISIQQDSGDCSTVAKAVSGSYMVQYSKHNLLY